MINNDLMLSVRSENSFKVNFKNIFISKFNQFKTEKIALLITSEYEGIYRNGGIGTYYNTLSQKLSEEGWYVIVIVCCYQNKFTGKSNIPYVKHIFSVGELEEVLTLQPIHSAILYQIQHSGIDYTSYRCLFFTQAIANVFKDSLIYVEFHEYGGIAYRTIQAKQSSILPANCLIAVTMHSGHEWIFEANERYLENELNWYWQTCYYEQYSFENADLAFFPSYYLKEKVESYGWNTNHAFHLPNYVPIIETIKSDKIPVNPQCDQKSKTISIVFFGRLEERKGLCIFIDALKALEPTIKSQLHIYFLGKIVPLQSTNLRHLNSQEYIQQELGQEDFKFDIISELYSKDAIQFVSELDNPIVCLASSQENFPNSALEMGQLSIRLIVSDTGGFRETLDLINRSAAVYWFKPKNSKSLTQVINKVIDTNIEYPEIPDKRSLLAINEELIVRKVKYIEDLFVNSSPKTYAEPKVTVGVTCYNLGKYILDCLNSLEAQTYKNLEVIVFDDASTDEHTQEIINQAQFMFPSFKFVKSDTNIGLGAARNHLINLAQGEYFIPFDADNIALPFMVEKLVKVSLNSHAAIVSSPLLGFGTPAIDCTPGTWIHSFTGGLMPTMLKENCWGDAGSLFSTELLRKFKHPEDRDVVSHDWQIMVASSAIGKKIAYHAYPVYLYRLRPDSMMRVNKNHARDQYNLRRYLSQLEPSSYSHRHIYFLLTATQQLLLSEERRQYQIQQVQTKLEQLKSQSAIQIQQTQTQLEQAKCRIVAMETSKFWKLRILWFKLKKKLGLPIDNE